MNMQAGPAGFSPTAARSGVMGQVRAISHRTWIVLAVASGIILFLIVMGVLKADQTRQTAELRPEATRTEAPDEVLSMIGDDLPEPEPSMPPVPLAEPAPPAPSGPTYEEMAYARMYAQEIAATSQPLSGGQAFTGGQLASFDAGTDPADDLSALEQQLHAQLGVLTQRISHMSGSGAAAAPELAGLGAGAGAGQPMTSGAAVDAGGAVRFEPAPRSPVIHEGWVVPARLDQLITSDIGGQVRALVTEDVYDSVTGRFLLIPAGTRAVGEYGNGVVFGQDRLAVVWTRLIFPDGSSLHITDAPGTDGLGSVGMRDRVNNHWGKVLGAALLSTVFSVGVAMANDDEGSVLDRPSNSDVARSTAANEVARVGSAITGRALTIPPTIEVRPGYALSIRVNRDWYLQPWRRSS